MEMGTETKMNMDIDMDMENGNAHKCVILSVLRRCCTNSRLPSTRFVWLEVPASLFKAS